MSNTEDTKIAHLNDEGKTDLTVGKTPVMPHGLQLVQNGKHLASVLWLQKTT